MSGTPEQIKELVRESFLLGPRNRIGAKYKSVGTLRSVTLINIHSIIGMYRQKLTRRITKSR